MTSYAGRIEEARRDLRVYTALEQARIRKEQRINRAKKMHKVKRKAWRAYAAVCIAGMALASCVAFVEAVTIVRAILRIIAGL